MIFSFEPVLANRHIQRAIGDLRERAQTKKGRFLAQIGITQEVYCSEVMPNPAIRLSSKGLLMALMAPKFRELKQLLTSLRGSSDLPMAKYLDPFFGQFF